MIDLSFELGVPIHELAHRMPEADFTLYQVYASKRMLPMRRIEMHLAQLTAVLAQVNGKDRTTADFLFDLQNSSEEPATADQAQQFFGFSPHVKGT